MPEPLSVETLSILSSTSELERVDNLIEQIAQDMGFDENARTDLGICVTEVVNNAIVHGHKRHSDFSIDIKFEKFSDALRVTVRDYGEGFDAHDLPDPTKPENLMKVNGRGIHLIRALMDEIKITPMDVGTEVVMVKRK